MNGHDIMIMEQELGQGPCTNVTKVRFFLFPPSRNCRIGCKSAVLSGMTPRTETPTVHLKLSAAVWLTHVSIVCLHMSTRSRNVLLTPLQEPRERSQHLVENREEKRGGGKQGRERTWTLAEPWSHRPPAQKYIHHPSYSSIWNSSRNNSSMFIPVWWVFWGF